jgi:ATP-dependent Clp protease adaptor protein ClpS
MFSMAQQTPSAPAQATPTANTLPASNSAKTAPQPADQKERQQLPPFNVILLNDNDHSYRYVVEMLNRLFGHNETKAYQIARTVDRRGRAIVLTTHKERAEFKRDQIRGYGSDPRIASSHCSMGAIIEPAE